MLNSFAATWAAVGGIVGAYGNFGPAGTRADVEAIARATEVSGAKIANYDNVQGISLRKFAADDCEAAQAQIEEMWRIATEKTRAIWITLRPTDFPQQRFDEQGAAIEDCDTLVMTITTAIIIAWGP